MPNFYGLVMDDEGNIEVKESDDEYNDKDSTEKLLAEDEYQIIQPSKKERKARHLWIKGTNHRKKGNLSMMSVNLVSQEQIL